MRNGIFSHLFLWCFYIIFLSNRKSYNYIQSQICSVRGCLCVIISSSNQNGSDMIPHHRTKICTNLPHHRTKICTNLFKDFFSKFLLYVFLLNLQHKFRNLSYSTHAVESHCGPVVVVVLTTCTVHQLRPTICLQCSVGIIFFSVQ